VAGRNNSRASSLVSRAKAEGRRQKAEGRRQKAEGRRQYKLATAFKAFNSPT